MNTQDVENSLRILRIRLSQYLQDNLKEKMSDQEYKSKCLKAGYLDNTIKALSELNKHGSEIIE